jgi:hypothetical protein
MVGQIRFEQRPSSLALTGLNQPVYLQQFW